MKENRKSKRKRNVFLLFLLFHLLLWKFLSISQLRFAVGAEQHDLFHHSLLDRLDLGVSGFEIGQLA